jgi:hypothetical protein
MFFVKDIENELKMLESDLASLCMHKSTIETRSLSSNLTNRDLESFLASIETLVKERQVALRDEIHGRRRLLNDLYDSVNAYEERLRAEVNWFHRLDARIDEQRQREEETRRRRVRAEHYESELESMAAECGQLKETLDPVAV